MTDNAWRLNAVMAEGSFDDPRCWMTRDLADGWQIHICLITDHYNTVISEIRIEPGPDTQLFGMRGHIDVPTGDDPHNPTWQCVTLPTARREASTALREAQQRANEAHQQREALREAGAALPPLKQTPDDFATQMASIRGFPTTPPPTRRRRPQSEQDLQLAIIAAAYADALSSPPRNRPRQGTQARLAEIGHYYAPSTLGPLIARARANGMLTPTRRGKAAGTVTARTHGLLRQTSFEAPWYTGGR